MARKPQGTKVRLHDPATGKIVWVERAAIHQTTDELAEVDPSAPAQDGSSPIASAPIHASPSAPSIAPTTSPTIVQREVTRDDLRAVARGQVPPDYVARYPESIANEGDQDEPDDVAEFLGEPPRRRTPAAPAPAPAIAPSSRTSSGDDVADFWAGDEPRVEDVEPCS